MKNAILLTSAGSAGVATVIGITSVLMQGNLSDANAYVSSLQTTLQLYQIAGMFGLLSVATFFVGMVYPASTAGGSQGGN